jgi:hypothetical protein
MSKPAKQNEKTGAPAASSTPKRKSSGMHVAERLMKLPISVGQKHQTVMSRLGGSMDGEIYTIKQLLVPFNVSQLVLADLCFGGATYNQLSPSLALLPQVSTLAALFDQYRITMVEIDAYPNNRVGSPEGVSTTLQPTLIGTVDFDDNANPAVLDVLREYQACKLYDITKPFQLSFKPRIAVAAYSGAFTSYANTESWLDVASPSVIHYGAKFGISGGLNAQTQLVNWWFSVRITVQFRHVR